MHESELRQHFDLCPKFVWCKAISIWLLFLCLIFFFKRHYILYLEILTVETNWLILVRYYVIRKLSFLVCTLSQEHCIKKKENSSIQLIFLIYIQYFISARAEKLVSNLWIWHQESESNCRSRNTLTYGLRESGHLWGDMI